MRLAPLALALLLAAPLAHVEGARPVSQLTQILRSVDVEMDGATARFTLQQNGEPLRMWVRHTIDPTRGALTAEHRIDEADPDGRFVVRWQIDRIVEYRDVNRNARFEPTIDTVAKSWAMQDYRWRVVTADQRVQVAGVNAHLVAWEGNLTGAPPLRLDAVAAGNDFTDEGAYTRPQDVLLYLEVKDLPPRGVGSLFAIEGSATSPAGARGTLATVSELRTGALLDKDNRRALLVWGGEATIDGREQALDATLGEPVARGDNETRALILHLPALDRSMRFVIIDGLEYVSTSKRSPGPEPALVLAAAALVALALNRSWRSRRG